MSLPIVPLPVVQKWDCNTRGSCCKEYLVTITDEERRRIESQEWDAEKDLDGYEPFRTAGPPWARRTHLNHRPDGSCVFLSEEGRCRIHERNGYESKPLPCRLFPFVLIPQGDRWGVGIRFACPSAAENLGRAVAEHEESLHTFADELVVREGLTPAPDGRMNPPPYLDGVRRTDWPELRRFVNALLELLRDRKDRLERRLRRCLTLAEQCRNTRHIHESRGEKLSELLQVLATYTDAETPRDFRTLPAPTWVGRVLFRQLAAVYSRKDHGPNQGIAAGGRIALLRAAWRFARGRGNVPQLHRWLPATTFEKIEETTGILTPAAEDVLERYYLVKVASMQFCGTPSFGMSFWEGFESLALTYPVLLWVARAFAPLPGEQSVLKALSIVDDHFGFNRVLGSLRQRFGMRMLARRGETAKLIAWYSR